MRLHMIGIFNTIPAPEYSHCPFTGKVLRFPKMMQAQGYEVIEYSNAGSLSEAKEKVVMLDDRTFHELKDLHQLEFPNMKANRASTLCRVFQEKLVHALTERVEPRDVICHPFGISHRELEQIFPQCYHLETSIGYKHAFAPYRIYPTYIWWHYHQGMEDRWGKHFEWVIPNGYDLSEWEPQDKPGDYILYFGRIVPDKGLAVVIEIAKRTDRKVILCGDGDPSHYLKDAPPNVEYLPPITGLARSDLLRNAYCILMPTQYTEPFGGSGVEALLCGTPLIGSDYGGFVETVHHGENGYRCKTLGDWLYAIENAGSLDRKAIAQAARHRYSIETVGKSISNALQQLQTLKDEGWYSTTPHLAIHPR